MKLMILFSRLCTDLFHALETYSKRIRQNLKTLDRQELQKILDIGGDIIDATDKLGQAHENFICFQLMMCICNLVLGIFFSVSIFSAVSSPAGWFNFRTLLSLVQICQTILGLLKFSALFLNGQWLKDRNIQVRKDLEDLHVEQIEMIGDKMRTKLRTLIKRLSEQPSLRPADSFDLDSSTALSCGGLLVTYLVVLLQFKTTDL